MAELQVKKSALLSILNTSGLQQKDQPLYQVIVNLIDTLARIATFVNTISGGSGGGGGGGGIVNNYTTIQQLLMGNNDGYSPISGNCMFPPGGIVTPASVVTADYVVASDGVVAGPTPINDGAGNFIYIPYVPSL